MSWAPNQTATAGSQTIKQIDWLKIGVATPDTILQSSFGEVEHDGTLHHRSHLPMNHGLFCERIFGPLYDWQCPCGASNGLKNPAQRGTVCNKCGVPILHSDARRERMGHITLAVPVANILFWKKTPVIQVCLNLTKAQVKSVIDLKSRLVTDPKNTPLALGQCLPLTQYSEDPDCQTYEMALETCEEQSFSAKTGVEAIREALSALDLEAEIESSQEKLNSSKNKNLQKKLAGRVALLRHFQADQIKPEAMVLTVLPVLPAGLRPLIPLGYGGTSGMGRYQTPIETQSPEVKMAYEDLSRLHKQDYPKKSAPSDPIGISNINELYGLVIRQNNRLKDFLQSGEAAKDVDIQSEKRKLQEAVDALLLKNVSGNGNGYLRGEKAKPLKSLADQLSGKTGRFRQNLLGKRVDFSGRSIIVVGPDLKLHQCGLPKRLALEVFEPFFQRRYREVHDRIYSKEEFKNWLIKVPEAVCDILEEVMRPRVVLLNRAPTLHRLSLLAFEPMLVEGHAIYLHPLTCPGYNADFDGDQMAVHLPLSDQAQAEARSLMLATHNLLSPATGKPIVTPSQDIVLGCYYLTCEPGIALHAPTAGSRLFGSVDEVIREYDLRRLKAHDAIRLVNPDRGKKSIWGNSTDKFLPTTVGRVVFNDIWPAQFGFVNQPVKKSDLGNMIGQCIKLLGMPETAIILDRLKQTGFQAATQAGISIGIEDIVIPSGKNDWVAKTRMEISNTKSHFKNGLITELERDHRIQDLWRNCKSKVEEMTVANLKQPRFNGESNPLWLMLDSGARGSREQVVQLAGMRGLMVKANGELTTDPIVSNFREGLSVPEFFSSCHGARKGTADTSLKTASAGYLTRKLVMAATDVVVEQEDCGTKDGRILIFNRREEETLASYAQRLSLWLLGRVLAAPLVSPADSSGGIFSAGEEIDENAITRLAQEISFKVSIRSVLTCKHPAGVCARCYGRDLAKGKLVKPGQPVGIIAAQSIGEPGTQLTMRTFHLGGVATDHGDITGGLPQVAKLLSATPPDNPAVLAKMDGLVSEELSKQGKIKLFITNAEGKQEKLKLPRGARALIKNGDTVTVGQRLTDGEVDPHAYLAAVGPFKFQERLVDQIMGIYDIQGVTINPKHVEVIARLMVTHPRAGGRDLCIGFSSDENKPELRGITQAALSANSFLAGAAFELTVKILAEAAVMGRQDNFRGIRESVMIGKLIPAGTGFVSPAESPS